MARLACLVCLGIAAGAMFARPMATSIPRWTGAVLASEPDAKPIASAGAKSTSRETETAGEASNPASAKGDTSAFETLTLRGKARFLGPALKDRYGIATVPESAERQIVLDVAGGELVPIVEDIRGRAFRADQRLRDIEVEILTRRYQGSPFAQVIQLAAVKKEGLFVLDYWCDVCAIAMYELKPCDCCQAPNRLRERRVTADGIADEAP